MSEITLGIIGGGQLGSMLAIAAKKLNVKTVVFCDDIDAPAQNFCNQFVTGSYDNKEKILEFINQVDLVTYEFENIPYETLNEINKFKIGLKCLGTDIKLISEKDAEQINPNTKLVLPWYFKKEILKREKKFLKKGGKLFFPMPYTHLISKKGEKKIYN